MNSAASVSAVPGHAGELVVHAEVVLQSNRGKGLVLVFDAHALFGLDRLVQALRVAPAGQNATGELVDDLDLAVLDDVLDVSLVELLGSDRLLEVVHHVHVDVVVEVLDAEDLLNFCDALFTDRDRALLLVDLVVNIAGESRRDLGELRVELLRLLNGSRDNQRRSGLVDKDRVHLVDHRKTMATLNETIFRRDHVVAQVVESELVVGSVGDVGGIRKATLFRWHRVLDETGLETEVAIDLTHPLGVAFHQVVVHGDEMHAFALQRVQIDGERSGLSLSLTGSHLCDPAVVERGTAH